MYKFGSIYFERFDENEYRFYRTQQQKNSDRKFLSRIQVYSFIGEVENADWVISLYQIPVVTLIQDGKAKRALDLLSHSL